jgi:CHRD domain-containing protein
MRRLAVFAVLVSIASWGCSDKTPTNPAALKPTFTAELRPANEVPPISNAENTGSGTATITFDVTRDGAGNITSGTATFVVNLTGFPAGTPFNIAHIHAAAAGSNGSIVFSTSLVAGEVVANATGAATFTKTGIAPPDPAILQQIVNNPAGYYFNVHSTLNPSGVARGQLVKTGG